MNFFIYASAKLSITRCTKASTDTVQGEFTYRAIHGNAAANANTEQHRGMQAKRILMQYNRFFISQVLMTVCLYRKPKTEAAHRKGNTHPPHTTLSAYTQTDHGSQLE